MIKINLLPPELQGKKGRSKVSVDVSLAPLIIGLATVIVVAGCGFFGYNTIKEVSTSKKQADEMQNARDEKKQEYDDNLAGYEDMKKKWDRMRDQEEILKVLIPEERLIWSEKLNMLANLIPEGVYITELEFQASRSQSTYPPVTRLSSVWSVS